jgi:hypothetical protein
MRTGDNYVDNYRHPTASNQTGRFAFLLRRYFTIDSKNDYKYVIIDDLKTGFEPMEVRSGYADNALHTNVEYRAANTPCVMAVRAGIH